MGDKFVAKCLCGDCEVEAEGPPVVTVNCHCSQCRRALSANYATITLFKPENLKVTKGEGNLASYATGKEERYWCKRCGSKVWVALRHLNSSGIYSDMFTSPNHGPDGKVDKRLAPVAHIFYTSGTTDHHDGLPKYVNLPKAFGGSDEQVPEDYHANRA